MLITSKEYIKIDAEKAASMTAEELADLYNKLVDEYNHLTLDYNKLRTISAVVLD